jgi:hypothetical protein
MARLGKAVKAMATSTGTSVGAAYRARIPRTNARQSTDITQEIVAVVGVLMVGANMQIKYGVTLGLLPVILLLPVWVSTIRNYRGASGLVVLAGVAVVAGTILALLAKGDHSVTARAMFAAALTVITAVGAIGVLLWACAVFRVDTVAILWAAGLAVSHLADHSGWAANPWKYGFALPASVAAVAWAGRLRSMWPAIIVISAAGVTSLVSDYRSFAGYCLIAVLVLIWQGAARSPRVKIHKLAPLLMLAAVGLAVYFVLVNLVISGYFGAHLQERSVAQVNASGSILIGGRPEWAATVQLMGERPQGFGLGVVPNAVDVGIGDAGLRSVNVEPANGYEAYMFGGAFRLHSITADLWTACGWAGLLLAAAFFVVLLRRLSTALAERNASALLVFTTLIALWAMGFSPIFTDFKDVTIAAFVALSTQRVQQTSRRSRVRSQQRAGARAV